VSGLMHRGQRAVPIAQVHAADAERIILAITRDAYEETAG
jgi:hypothetical protein